MNRSQMNLSEMLQTLEEFLTANLSSFENRPAILAIIEQLRTSNAEIKRLNLSQSTSTKADFAIKQTDEEFLIATAVKVSEGLKVIAATNKDERLKIEANTSEWDLSRMRKDDLYVRLQQLHATALPFVNQLLPLSISQAEVDSLNTYTTKLAKVKPAINTKKAKISEATSDLGQTITEINTVVRETLGDLMLEFKLLNHCPYFSSNSLHLTISISYNLSFKFTFKWSCTAV
ncbi:MAG: hypothetical protein KA753_04110 [Paludibacter sp.]|nr:hypothetical protein [Paludibacter sp.]